MTRTLPWWALGIVAVLLVLELLCRLLPVSTSTAAGYYVDPLILSYPPHHRWTTSTGWDLRNPQHMESNNFGFVSSHDFVHNEEAVALIGDSFVEASMLDPADRPGAQLERALRSRPVYALGAPGSALLDYAERIRFMSQKFGVKDFVVLMERTDVRQSLCGSGNIHGPCLNPVSLESETQIKPAPSAAKEIIRHSALAQYLVSQLKADPQQIFANLVSMTRSRFSRGSATEVDMKDHGRISDAAVWAESLDKVTRTFFDRIKPYTGNGTLVIVLDSDRRALYDGKMRLDPDRLRFMEAARASGAYVVDLDPIFRAHFRSSPMQFDVGPYDGHLNSLGVRMAMDAAAKELARAAPQ